MAYEIEILPEALRQLNNLPHKIKGQIVKKIDRLASDPFPPGCAQLQGTVDGSYRIRSGDYRILYTVKGTKILVGSVGNRKDVYRNL